MEHGVAEDLGPKDDRLNGEVSQHMKCKKTKHPPTIQNGCQTECLNPNISNYHWAGADKFKLLLKLTDVH